MRSECLSNDLENVSQPCLLHSNISDVQISPKSFDITFFKEKTLHFVSSTGFLPNIRRSISVKRYLETSYLFDR